MPPSIAKFLYTGGPESQVLERVDWFGRYNRMILAERSEHRMVICTVMTVYGQCFLRVTTEPRDEGVGVTLEAWTTTAIHGEWNANPNERYGALYAGFAWGYAMALAQYLGASQPENLFVHPRW